MKPYPEYKPTGLAWLPQVPSWWGVERLKTQFDERKENNKSGGELMILSLMKDVGVIPYDEKGNVGNKSKDDISQYKVARKGDLVLNSMNVIIGSVGVTPYDGLISPAYYSLMPRQETDVRYYDFLFHLPGVQQAIRGYAKGIMEIRLRISTIDLLGMKFPVPPHAEQRAIVSYLDRETAKIDRLIQLKERMVELLQEKKQATISRVVTRGLDPNAELVDSGVDWLGPVPKGWRVVPLKKIGHVINGREIGNELKADDPNAVPVYGSGGVFKYTDMATYDGVAVLFGRKGTLGKPILVDGRFAVVDTMYLSYYNEEVVNSKYVFYGLKVFDWMPYITHTAIPSLVANDMFCKKFPLPPLPEQRAIVAYLDAATAKIDAAVKAIEKSVGLLKERRVRLVSDAVTGRGRVSEVVI